jgi:hypothetical protein
LINRLKKPTNAPKVLKTEKRKLRNLNATANRKKTVKKVTTGGVTKKKGSSLLRFFIFVISLIGAVGSLGLLILYLVLKRERSY